MKRNFLFVPMVAVSLLATSALAFAQPDPNEAPKGVNPAAMAQPFPGFGGDWQKMTPEQRKEAMRKLTEQMVRMSMGMMGFNDKPMQDAVVATAMEHEKDLDEVRTKNHVVIQGLMGKINDEQMATALADLESAQEDVAESRKKQIEELDKKIDFSSKPRLKAYLTLVGVIGDGSSQMGGVLGNITGAMTNMMLAGDNPQAMPRPAQ